MYVVSDLNYVFYIGDSSDPKVYFVKGQGHWSWSPCLPRVWSEEEGYYPVSEKWLMLRGIPLCK